MMIVNEEEIKKIARETFIENVMNNLDSAIIFKYIQELEQENQRLKEVINKAIEYINNNYPLRTSFSKNIYDFKIEIKKILTGDSNE